MVLIEFCYHGTNQTIPDPLFIFVGFHRMCVECFNPNANIWNLLAHHMLPQRAASMQQGEYKTYFWIPNATVHNNSSPAIFFTWTKSKMRLLSSLFGDAKKKWRYQSLQGCHRASRIVLTLLHPPPTLDHSHPLAELHEPMMTIAIGSYQDREGWCVSETVEVAHKEWRSYKRIALICLDRNDTSTKIWLTTKIFEIQRRVNDFYTMIWWNLDDFWVMRISATSKGRP